MISLSTVIIYRKRQRTSSLAFDEEREREVAEAFLKRKEKSVVKNIDLGATFKNVTVLEPACKCAILWDLNGTAYS